MKSNQKNSKKERKEEILKELNIKYKGYADYVHSNEVLGVHIVRDVVKKINTKGYWIEIVLHEKNNPRNCFDRYSPNSYIVCRLYPRVTKPNYPPKPNTTDEYLLEKWQCEIDAITWQTAQKDIFYWQCKGNTGKMKTHICYYEQYYFEKDNQGNKFKKYEDTQIRIKSVKSLTDKEFNEII